MIWFILYMMIAALYFSWCYVSMRRIYKEHKSWYDDDDIVFNCLCLSVPWLLTIWFFVPYVIINTKNIQRKSQ